MCPLGSHAVDVNRPGAICVRYRAPGFGTIHRRLGLKPASSHGKSGPAFPEHGNDRLWRQVFEKVFVEYGIGGTGGEGERFAQIPGEVRTHAEKVDVHPALEEEIAAPQVKS